MKRKKPRLEWSNLEVELMKYCISKGMNRHQTGLRIGRTCAAVKRKMVREDQPYMRPLPHLYSYANEQYMKERWLSGASAGVITRELSAIMEKSLTRNMIIGKLKRMGCFGSREKIRRPTERVKRLGKEPRPKRIKIPRRFFVSRNTIICDLPSGPTVSFVDNRGCMYPFGVDEPRDFVFCGAPKVDKYSYCGYHYAKCYKSIRYKQRPATDAVAVGSSATVPPVSAGEPLQ